MLELFTMMEVHQPVTCLSPTQRLSSLSSHQPPPSLHSPLALPLRAPPVPSPSSTMIIEASLHSSVSTPPDSPQQGETMPSVDIAKKEFMPDDFQVDRGMSEKLPKDPPESRTLWNGNTSVSGDMRDGMDIFTHRVMSSKGLNGEGSPSPVPLQLSPKERLSVISEGEESQRSINECYTPPSNPASEGTDRRQSRRKQTLEDIVRRMRTVEPPEHMYDSDDDMDQEDMMPLDESQLPEDEVDGTPMMMPRYLSPQACAESVIKRSMQGHYRGCEDMEEEEEIMEDNSCHESENFLHVSKSRDDCSRSPSASPELLHEPKMNHSLLTQERAVRAPNSQGEDLERKGLLDSLPKSGLPPHMPPSLGGGLHCSLPLSSNISETAYSPHHYSASKVNGWGFPGALPHMFPFSPASMLDHHGLGRKFLPFDSKMMPEVDKDYLKCSYCERTFRRQKNLENHIENTHQGKGAQRPKRENGDMYFKCTHCPYTTKHQSNLYVHLRIHTGERPYICGACGVQYSQSHSLKSHIINKHDGIMSYYIKEKRNRSPRGMGYMTTQVVSSADSNIFKLPPPPGMPSLQQSNMELVAKAIELAKNATSTEMSHPPPLLPAHPQHPHSHPGPPPSMTSPLMSPNAAMPAGPHGVFSKHSPQFPFNGHYFGGSMPYGDLPATPTPAMIPLPSPGGHMSNGASAISPTSNSNRGEMGLNLSAGQGTPTSISGFMPMSNMASSLSPSNGLLQSPNNNNINNNNSNTSNNNNNNNNNNNSKTSNTPDCGAIDLSKKAHDMSLQRGGSCEDNPEHIGCRNCGHANKLKLLRFNVVRMLSILVPNLNFEEKGISADSDSVDELLQDVIESNTHDDDMLM